MVHYAPQPTDPRTRLKTAAFGHALMKKNSIKIKQMALLYRETERKHCDGSIIKGGKKKGVLIDT